MKLLSIFKNKEAKNAGWLIGGKIFQMVLSLFVGVLTARFLGPDNYGIINYGAAFVALFSSLCTLGLNSVIIKDFVDNPDEQGVAIGSSILMRFLSSVASALMIVGISCVIDREEPMTVLVVSLCSIGVIFQVFDTINYWFQAQYKSKITAIATLVAYAVMSAYKIILLILGAEVYWFAIATALDYLVIAIFLLLAYKKHKGPKFSVSFVKAKKLLGNSYHYILSGMMVAIYGQTDKLMLKQMLSETEVGYYSVATALCSMWVFVLAAIIDSMYPTILQLYGSDRRAFEKKNRQLYAIVFYVSAFVSILFVLFGNIGIRILYGKEYLPAALPLKIITWYTAFSYLGVARNAWIVSEGKQKYLKYIYVFAAVLNVALNVIFIPIWGASGAAVASLITQIFTGILLPYCIKELRPNAKLMLEAIILKDVF